MVVPTDEPQPNVAAADEPEQGNRRHHIIARRIVVRFLPNSYIRLFWDAFIFLVIWYNAVLTPVRIFVTRDRTPKVLVSLDVLFDFIFVFDTLLRFYRPYVDENTGGVVTDPRLIRRKYQRSATFYVNAIACVPILKLPISPFLDGVQLSTLLTYLNVLRMIRVLHLPEQFFELKRFLERNGPINEPVYRMHIIFFFMVLFICECGCLYFGLSTATTVDDICPPSEVFADDILGEEMWVAKDTVITNVMDTRVCETSSSVECEDCPQPIFFTRSVYFLMQTIFTIGYGDTVVPSKASIEMAMSCVFMIFGVFAYALTIANMTSVLANLDVVNMQFRQEQDTLSHWMSLRTIPARLRQRIQAYFSYLSRSQHGMLDDVILRELPNQLAAELAERHIGLLARVPFFDRSRRSQEFLSMVSKVLRRRVFTPGTFVMHQGELQRELIIFSSGKAHILVRGVKEPVGTLLPGDFVGDYALLFGVPNQVSCQTADFSEVLALDFASFKLVMDHPRNEQFGFASVGYTFRNSGIDGCSKTIQATKESLRKISSTVSTVTCGGGKGRDKLKDMMEQHSAVSKSFSIPPDSKVHLVWDLFSIFAILYYAIESPIRLASHVRLGNLDSFHTSMVLGYVIDVFFIVDMILRSTMYSFSTHEHGKTVVVSDPGAILRRYRSSPKFRVDLLATLPLDILSVWTGGHALFRLTKLLRILQIPMSISSLQTHLDVCLDAKTSETQRSVLLMMLYSLLLVVWCSSGWYALRQDETSLVSVYWTITTLTTVGYGDVTPQDFVETVYALFVGAIGAVFTASIVANITSFFHDAELTDNNYDHQLHCIKRFMDRHRVPVETSKDIAEYFSLVEEEHGGLNEPLLLRDSIPGHLSASFLIHIAEPMVESCDLLANCEPDFLRRIMVSLEQVYVCAQYTVLTSEVPSDRAFFIKQGSVELLVERQDKRLEMLGESEKKTTLLRKLDANDCFAEGCLVERWTSNPFIARTTSESELWTLKRSVFKEILKDFPKSRKLVEQADAASKGAAPTTRRRASVRGALKAAEFVRRKTALYLHPHSHLAQMWFGVLLAAILYSTVVIPFRAAFLENHVMSWDWMLLDYFADTIFFADLIIRAFFLGFHDENNNLQVDRMAILANCLRSGQFKWHLMATIPVETAMLFVPMSRFCPLGPLQAWSCLRLNKLLRSIEVPSLIRKVETSLAHLGVRVPRNGTKVGKLLMVILLLAHLACCVFFAMANFNQHRAVSGQRENWANDEGLLQPRPSCPGAPVPIDTVNVQYTAGLYWAMATISTAGYGDVTGNTKSSPEVIYSILILIVGMLVYSVVIAQLEGIVSQLDVTSSLHKLQTSKASAFAQIASLPDHLRVRIQDYYDLLWNSHLGVKGDRLLGYLPISLKADLIRDIVTPYLEDCFFIKDSGLDFQRYIVQSLVLEVYLPGEHLFHAGQECDTLFFVYKGSVDLQTEAGVKFKTVALCSMFEFSAFLFEPHLCTAVTGTRCETFHLRMDVFLKGLRDFNLEDEFKRYLSVNESVLSSSKAEINKTIQNLSSSKMVKFLNASKTMVKVTKGVFLPNSPEYFGWCLVTFLGCIYYTISIPLKISFATSATSLSAFLLDLLVDTIFVADVYMCLRKLAVKMPSGIMSDPKQFGKHYLETDFRLDILSLIPLATCAYLFGVRGTLYGCARLFQLPRVVRTGKYLGGLVEWINVRSSLDITTASLRIFQIFALIIVLVHLFGCVFHLLGIENEDSPGETWIVVDGMEDEPSSRRYLRSFYWSLYTITTIGFGSVPVVTIPERILAMATMAIGAVICDAGLTAVLASIISNKDRQAGTNSRRIQCCKLYMETTDVDETLQERILDFYSYTDNSVKNVNEDEILGSLSPSLASEIVQYFCLSPLRSCALFDKYEGGAIYSLIKLMKPYLAVPGECLSRIGSPCDSIFVVTERGSIRTMNAEGFISDAVEGTIVGHAATSANSKRDGSPTHRLRLELISANIKSKGDTYIVFEGVKSRCRPPSSSDGGLSQTIFDKQVEADTGEYRCKLAVKEWRKRRSELIGTGEAAIPTHRTNMSPFLSSVAIASKSGRVMGTIQLKGSLMPLEAGATLSHELTCTSQSYSHLFRLELSDERRLGQVFRAASLPLLDRIPSSLSVAAEENSAYQNEDGTDWNLELKLNHVDRTGRDGRKASRRKSSIFKL